MNPEYRYLSLRLRLEQQRLFNWSSEVGLLRYLEEEEATGNYILRGISRSIVLGTLEQIQKLMDDFIKCKDGFGGLVSEDSNLDLESVLEKNYEESQVYFPRITDFLRKQKNSTPFVRRLPKRLKWVTFYKEKFEALIRRFRELNDVLIDLVDSDARIAIGRSTRETNTAVLHMHSKMDELANLVRALSPELSSTYSAIDNKEVQYAGYSDIQQQHEFAALAYFKAASVDSQDNGSFRLDRQSILNFDYRDMKPPQHDVHHTLGFDELDARCEADFHQPNGSHQRVWIEWRDHDSTFRPWADAKKTKFSRIEKLVALLCDSHKPDFLRVPRCLGYFEDSKYQAEECRRRGRLGFVFEKPFPNAGNPVSLRYLVNNERKPLLTDRISLAKVVANSLMSLHSVNWLHKRLSSHNVIFFPDGDGIIDYTSPFLAGFDYARPASRKDMTEIPSQNPEHDMYRHPFTHGFGPWEGRHGYKRTFDIYSLGIVFVEVANWETVDRVLNLGDPKALDDSTLANIQKRLLEENIHIEAVGSNAGHRYRDATRSCLKGASGFDIGVLEDETNECINIKLSSRFFHQVLKRLEEIQT